MKSDQDSGWRWGPFVMVDDPKFQGRRPLYTQQKGGCVHYPYQGPWKEKHSQHISQVDTTKPIIHKGNHFSHFTHPRDYPPDCEFYFWDNSLLPQLMQPREHYEDCLSWARICYRSTMPGWVPATEAELDQHESRINHRLRLQSQGWITDWRQLIEIRRRATGGRQVLLLLPSENALHYYYGWRSAELTAKIHEACRKINLELVVRSKPTRRDRNEGNTVARQLSGGDYRCVITVNSAAAIESLCLGYPTVCLGAHQLAQLSTPWEEFSKNWFCPPEPQFVEQRCRQLLTQTWHKQELLEGSWALSPLTAQTEPYQGWEITI